MEPEGSIPNSQELSACPCPEPDQSSPHHPIPPLQDPPPLILSTHLRLGSPSGLFPSAFPTNLYAFLLCFQVFKVPDDGQSPESEQFWKPCSVASVSKQHNWHILTTMPKNLPWNDVTKVTKSWHGNTERVIIHLKKNYQIRVCPGIDPVHVLWINLYGLSKL
jgi:hypothetical protein